MRIGCLQFAPLVGDVDNNLNRADAVLAKADIEELDLLVLPELAFTGYNFKSLQQITPFLEHSGSGITSLWARSTALKYNCVVAAGYPEEVDITAQWPTGPEYYNSTILVDGDGEMIGNYRKSFLYHIDETWALESTDGFFTSWIPRLGNTSLGICMDLNPYQFKAPWDAFEFAHHIQEVQSNLVIVTMAWITRENNQSSSPLSDEPDMDTLAYWVTRLEPLIRSQSSDEIIVVFCSRSGREAEATYVGTSAVIGIKLGEVRVYGVLGRGQSHLLVVDTETTPYAKLGNSNMEGTAEAVEEEPLNPYSEEPLLLPLVETAGPETCSQVSWSNFPTKVIDGVEVWTGNVVKEKGDLKPAYHNPPRRPGSHEMLPLEVATTPVLPSKERLTCVSKEISGNIENMPIQNNSLHYGPPTPVHSPRATPVTVLPKLIIPPSPQILPSYFSPEDPTSALSTFSQQSLQSINSTDSKLSIQTVRSNPRPPEDSTPYPLSGAPLSGYPSNSFHDHPFKEQKFIYAGYVSITQGDNPSLETTLAEMTPISPQWYWQVSDNALITPISAGVWPSSTPVGRQPEPFPWPIITNIPKPSDNSAVYDQSTNDITPKEANKTLDTMFPPAQTILEKRIQEESPNIIDVVHKPQTPSRPSSPKSRNASRSRIHSRSHSLSLYDTSPVATEILQNVSQTTRSLSTRRQSIMDLATICKDQSHSRGRDFHGYTSKPHSINQEFLAHQADPTSLAYQLYVDSSGSGEAHRIAAMRRSEPAWKLSQTEITGKNPARAFSRGRQPGSAAITDLNGTSPPPKRSTSTDSTRNDILHRRVPSKASSHRDGTPRRRPSRSQASRQDRMSARGLQEFERVEEIVCANCPIHNTRLASVASSPRDRASSSRRRSDTASQRRTPSSRRETRDLNDNHTRSPAALLHRQASSSHLTSTRPSMTPPPRSTTAPIPTETFDPTNPTTPKAMSFRQMGILQNVEDLFLQPTTYNPNAPLGGFRATTYYNPSRQAAA